MTSGPPLTSSVGADSPPTTERLHALDAVRAFALLLGVLLHSFAAFVAGFPIPAWFDKAATEPTVAYYTIHIFRMSVFFLMAGFFGRLLLEREGGRPFIKARLLRIAVPLVAFLILLPPLLAAAAILGSLPHCGLSYLQTLLPPPDARGAAGPGAGPNLTIYWFLYYLLIFYVGALAMRAGIRAVDPGGAMALMADRVLRRLLRGPLGAVLIAIPLAILFLAQANWNEWTGLPAPMAFTPEPFALLGYGLPFVLGWLLQRQVPLLLELQRHCLLNLALALVATAACLKFVGATAYWDGARLAGYERIAYATCYAAAVWFWTFGLVGAALRYLSLPSRVIRYLSDASYWIYLTHLIPLAFFLVLVRPFEWHWSIKLAIVLGGSVPILLGSYNLLVRSTFIGAILNGRRFHRRRRGAPDGLGQAV